MNSGTLIFSGLILVLLIFSILRYLKTPVSRRLRMFFISLRILLVLLLFISYAEPEIHFDRINRNQTIPVLIDASLSMSLFQPESSVIPVLQTIKSTNTTSQNRKFVFYIFGDSLRELRNSSDLKKYNDQNSIFPTLSQTKILNNSRNIFVISDANWTNKQINLDQFSNKIIHYLPLSKKMSTPYLSLATSESFSTSPADSSVHVAVTVNGFASEKSTLKVELFQHNKILQSKNVETEAGYISKSVDLTLPPTTPGKIIYRIEVSALNKQLFTMCHFLRNATPQTFSYSLQPTVNSLDLRFIKLCFSRHPEFHEIPFEKGKPDLLFFFKNDSAAIKNCALKENGIRVFAGILPYNNSITYNISNNFTFTPPPNTSPMATLNINNLPPPSKVLTSSELIPLSTILSGNIHSQSKQITVPIICTTELLHNAATILTGRDFWKWDFWPLSVTQSEENAFSFSDVLVSFLKEQLISNISDSFYTYTTSNIKENDSIPFQLLFPSSVPAQTKGQVILEVKGISNTTNMEQSFTVIKTGSQNQKIQFKPLPEGRYNYTGRLKTERKLYSFSDVFYIGKNQAELTITDQNRTLLDQIGQPIDQKNLALFTKRFLSDQNNTDELTRVNFKISRGWYLLATIFLLFSVEWILRRYQRLD